MEIGALSLPIMGETQNGDGYFVAAMNTESGSNPATISSLEVKFPINPIQTLDTRGRDLILIAVLDGVGHGSEAAAVTNELIECLKGNFTQDLGDLVRQCHQRVKHSRGAAIGIALVDEQKSVIDFLGVGNVRLQVGPMGSGRDLSENTSGKIHELISNRGIVGYNLPARLASYTHKYQPNDTLVMFTDGIDEKFSLGSLLAHKSQSPAQLADSVLAKFGKKTDDATVVVAR